jgi:hypothetical protein
MIVAIAYKETLNRLRRYDAVMARREVRQQFGRGGKTMKSPIAGPPNIKAKS